MKIEDIVEYAIGAVIGIIIYENLISKAKPQIINKIVRTLIYVAIPFDIFFILNTIIHFPG